MVSDMSDIKELAQKLTELTKYGIQGMSDEQVKEHRKAILALSKQCNKALSETSQKDHDYDDSLIIKYIDEILERGYRLEETKLAHNTMFVEAQKLTRFKHFIKHRVQHSCFSSKQFKVKELQYQRLQIEQSSTLHELRQNVKAIIGPLKLYREYNTELPQLEYELATEDSLIKEIEQLTLELEDKKRIIREITHLYDTPLLDLKNKETTVKEIEEFKLVNNCSDEEACKVFDISRSKLKRMRSDILSCKSEGSG